MDAGPGDLVGATQRTEPMKSRRLTLENHINTIRMALAQIDEMLTGMEEGIEVDSAPAFDPKKLYRCRDPEFHAVIHYIDSDDRHHGSVWKDSNPTFTMSWNSAGRRFDRGGDSDLDLVNYDNDANPSPDPREAAIAKDHRKQLDLRMMIDLGNHMVKQVGDRLLVEAWANAIKNIRDNTGISILPAENRG